MNRRDLLLGFLALPALAACKSDGASAALPPPREITADSVAQICGMNLTEHAGPKAQIFLRDIQDPFWFATVRDAIAYSVLPEMPKAIVAFYVNDMARAKNWDQPEAGVWIEASRAIYVIASRRPSGMNADEAIPFGERGAAERFAATNGGRIVRLAEIPADYVLASSTGEP